MNYSKLFIKSKGQIQKYLKSKTFGLNGSIKRTINEIFYGVLHSGDVMLTNVARSLNEKISIKKIVERLSRNLSKEDFTESLENNHIKNISWQINKKSIIVIDDSDITKKRSKHLEGLCPIRDASEDKIGKGFYLQYSCLVSPDRADVKSIITRLYSTLEKGFLSRGHERDKLLYKLFESFDDNGVYVADRGFSEYRYLQHFGNKRSFVIRAKNRNITVNGKIKDLYEWANKIKLRYSLVVETEKGNEKRIQHDVVFCVRKIQVKDIDISAVVMKLDDHRACIMFTNQEIGSMTEYDFGKMVIEQYGCRWSVEEKIRFEKQQFNYENIRIRNLTAIKNYMSIINLISSFISNLMYSKLSIKIIEISKSIKEEVRFQYYRVAVGLQILFRMRSSAVFEFKEYRSYFPKYRQLQFWEY